MKLLQSIILLTTMIFTVNANADVAQDTAITAAVKMLLVKEQDIPATDIEVTTKDRIVHLNGKVATKLQANRAVELASSIKDVVDVDADKLDVKSSDTFLSDSYITAKVKGKIQYLSLNKDINSDYELHVETTNQVVHIMGYAKSKHDISVIEEAVRNMAKVKDVKLNVSVK